MAGRPVMRVTGRDGELALLSEAVTGLRAGRGRSVLIEGEAGIGKSALLATLTGPGGTNPAAGGLDGTRVRVVRAICDELTQRFPLSAITQAPGLSEAGGTVPADPGAAAQGLSLAPEDPVLAAVEELLGLVHRLCAERPLILAVEDMHWADEASVLLWRRLCRVTTQLPLLLIATRRPLPRGAPLERDVAGRGGIVITLTGLGAGDVARMAADVTGGTPGPRLLHWLEPAAGNPFYVRELLDAALRSGAAGPAGDAGTVELTEQPGTADGLGGQVTSLRQAVASRLDFLAPGELRVLRIAALLGPEFPVTDLAAVTGQTTAALLPVIEDVIAAGILEPTGDQLRFRHGLLQQALYEGMPAPLRAGLHRQAAQSLIELRAPAERVARQLLPLPGLGETWEMDWLAANAAPLAATAPLAAATLLERALGNLAPHDSRRPALEDQLASMLFAVGRYEQVERLTATILTQVTDPDRYSYLTWTRAYALLRIPRYDEARTVLEAAAARSGVSAVWRARFQAVWAMLQTESDAGTSADADAAVAAARRLDDPTALAYALQARVIWHYSAGELSAALDLTDQALSLTAADPHLADLRLLLTMNWVDIAGMVGRSGAAMALARQTLADHEPSGSPRLGMIRYYLARLAWESGQWDEAIAEIDAVTGMEHGSGQAQWLPALIAGHQDDWRQASQHLAAMKRWAGEHADLHPRSAAPGEVALALALEREAAGDLPGAVEHLADRLALAMEFGPAKRHKLLPTLTRLALAVADGPAVQAALRAARQEDDQQPQAYQRAVVGWCEGLAQADPGPVQDAALALRELGLPLETGNALEDAAVLLAQAGDITAARSVLDEALAGYEQLGAAWDARRAAARIRPHGVRPGVRSLRRRPQTGWPSLTSTETQVAQLLAEGRSNPDIAAQLFISRRTVESHVSHILAKLQLTSRWEVRDAATGPDGQGGPAQSSAAR